MSNGLILGIYISLLIVQVHTILMHQNISSIRKSLDEIKKLLKEGNVEDAKRTDL